MFLITLAIAPAIAIMFYVYKRDKYEKEPKKLLAKLFFLGVLSTLPAMFIDFILSNGFHLDVTEEENPNLIRLFIYCILGVGLVEEGSKYIFLRLSTRKNKNFNEYFDGIVYAVFLSLGFATFENIFYVTSEGFLNGLFRAFLSVPGHAIFAINMGYYYSLARFTRDPVKRKKYNFLSVVIPMVLHGMFDFLVFSGLSIFIFIYFIFIIFLYWLGFRRMRQLSDRDYKFSID